MIISLALSDAFLFCICFYILLAASQSVTFKFGVSLVSAASCLGVMKFSEIFPLPSLHAFFSSLSASSAILMITVGVIWRDRLVATSLRYAWILFVSSAAVTLIMSNAFGLIYFGYAIAGVSTVALIFHQAILKSRDGLIGGVSLLFGFLIFLTKIELFTFLKPGDYLHFFMALGVYKLSRSTGLV